MGRWKSQNGIYYVNDIVGAIYKLMHSDFDSSVNIGPSDDISVNGLVKNNFKNFREGN